MNTVHTVLSAAWLMQYPLIPCAAGILLYELPNIIRRITRRMYVPIYFSFSPFGYSDELYARYFDEDHYWMVGGPYSRTEMKLARVRIIFLTVFSALITLIVSPFITSFAAYYFYTDRQFDFLFWTVAVLKLALYGVALYDLRFRWQVTSHVPFAYLAFIYLVHWWFQLVFLDKSYQWIAANANEGLWMLLSNITDLVVGFAWEILVIGLLSYAIPALMTNQRGRKELESEPEN